MNLLPLLLAGIAVVTFFQAQQDRKVKQIPPGAEGTPPVEPDEIERRQHRQAGAVITTITKKDPVTGITTREVHKAPTNAAMVRKYYPSVYKRAAGMTPEARRRAIRRFRAMPIARQQEIAARLRRRPTDRRNAILAQVQGMQSRAARIL
jgi:hypothetical protein